MRVHHLNCGTMCPVGRRLIGANGGLLSRARLVAHCLLVELPSDGLLLVDTGFGFGDIEKPSRLGSARHLLSPVLDPLETALHQVEQLGFHPSDVRHIAITHLDIDHAGGLSDFPQARVHIMRAEHQDATSPQNRADAARYRAAQWAHGADFRLYDPRGEAWFGFEAVRELEGLPPEILMVPLTGHSRGHAGVAIDTGDGWLLHAGDAYFHRGEMDTREPYCPPGLQLAQKATGTDDVARLWNQRRLRALRREHGHEIEIICAHDPVELSRHRLNAAQ